MNEWRSHGSSALGRKPCKIPFIFIVFLQRTLCVNIFKFSVAKFIGDPTVKSADKLCVTAGPDITDVLS
jgi:hypothetical protein